MLSLLGNLNALKAARSAPPSSVRSHSPKMAASVAHPSASVTVYSFSTFVATSLVLAMQLRANPPYMPEEISTKVSK